jgi:hypothetical protein
MKFSVKMRPEDLRLFESRAGGVPYHAVRSVLDPAGIEALEEVEIVIKRKRHGASSKDLKPIQDFVPSTETLKTNKLKVMQLV